MQVLLSIALKYWYAIVIALLLIAAWALHAETDHVRAQLATLQATLAQIRAEGALQAAHAAQVNHDQQVESEEIAAQLSAALIAHRATADSLAERVRQYEALSHRCALPGKPNPPADGPRPDPSQSSPSAAGSVGETIAALIPACQALIDQDRACGAWAAAVRCQ